MHCHLQRFRKIWPVYSESPSPNFIYPDVFHFEQMVNQPSGCEAGWAFRKGFKTINKRMDNSASSRRGCMSKYKAQSPAKIKRREVEAASVRSKGRAKVEHRAFLRTEDRTLPTVLTPRGALACRFPLEAGVRGLPAAVRWQGASAKLGEQGWLCRAHPCSDRQLAALLLSNPFWL